ncbi:disulfide bond formation protein DsbA [Candidatus Kaiserbacteria bacterium CG10_big_fil_rev_8_21_14_0_10_59_10]|uniref:Disulfide bond formation protein DsbA n=1 Tax=Candidatus Kaiserbacteria bacterium CG10_big_fil_rev_8_21_14_0_10_59_10 TaxID=1974612 RepID=A0A2H0U8K6_9BACT|nr:MAG: disulfide bond formation protein DsbA [Candidatus Kaiserbacteria bacterium CG10_big_fil_rev_8_21_14_0_10_59_10]
MDTMQKLAVPISIVVAGALIAGAVFFVNMNNATAGPADPGSGVVAEEIRGVQPDDHILGNPNAKLVIVEFSDTECPFCKQFHGTLHRVIEEYGGSGEVAWVYRHFPLPQLHPNAPKQAEALECAAELGGNELFWRYTDLLYQTMPQTGLDMGAYDVTGRSARTDGGQLVDMAAELGMDTAAFQSCLDSGKYESRVELDWNEAVAAGGRGTPHSIIIVDGEQIPIEGAQPFEVVKGIIDTLL